ncbi:hypothetical protein J4419_04880 [Candidatus Woesearchaeota archaeon]|nr:hypothetical protein [Candidatus Woesearchaeota archaeon]
MKIPESMDGCVYFTNRTLPKGKVMAWARRKECPKCHKAQMGKPVEKGKVKIRADIYVCPSCGFTEQKIVHEEGLTLEAVYTCLHCGKQGESSAPYKRKSFQGVQSFVVECQHCAGKIPLTKKLKGIGDPDSDS